MWRQFSKNTVDANTIYTVNKLSIDYHGNNFKIEANSRAQFNILTDANEATAKRCICEDVKGKVPLQNWLYWVNIKCSIVKKFLGITSLESIILSYYCNECQNSLWWLSCLFFRFVCGCYPSACRRIFVHFNGSERQWRCRSGQFWNYSLKWEGRAISIVAASSVGVFDEVESLWMVFGRQMELSLQTSDGFCREPENFRLSWYRLNSV